MDFNEVAIFIKVIQKGSFTRAASALNMPKSTVSTKISNLEKRLGIALLTRSTRKLRLTPAGEVFFLRSTKAIDEIMAAEVAVRSGNAEPQGRFRVAAPVDIGNTILPELTALFLKKFPKVQMEIVLSDQIVNFIEDEIDLAIRAGELKDSSLIAKKVGEVAFKIYASPKYLKECGEPASLKELGSHKCILFSSISKDGWVLKDGKRSAIVSLKEKIVVNDMSLVYSLAKYGAGIALLPSFICEYEIKAGKLIHILREWRTDIVPMHFVYPAQRYVSPVTKAFMEVSTEALRNRFKILEN